MTRGVRAVPNQTRRGVSDVSGDKYYFSYLPGQRLSRYTYPDEGHHARCLHFLD